MKLLDEFDPGTVCWESDFPHSDSNWPNAPEELSALFASNGIDASVLDKVTHENAMRHYQFDPFKIRGREKCTVGALRAEAPDVDVVTRVGQLASDHDLEAWRTMTSRARIPASR